MPWESVSAREPVATFVLTQLVTPSKCRLRRSGPDFLSLIRVTFGDATPTISRRGRTTGAVAAMRTSETDAELVSAAQGGDKEAFAALFTRHRPLLVAVCRRALTDPVLSDDAVRETANRRRLMRRSMRCSPIIRCSVTRRQFCCSVPPVSHGQQPRIRNDRET